MEIVLLALGEWPDYRRAAGAFGCCFDEPSKELAEFIVSTLAMWSDPKAAGRFFALWYPPLRYFLPGICASVSGAANADVLFEIAMQTFFGWLKCSRFGPPWEPEAAAQFLEAWDPPTSREAPIDMAREWRVTRACPLAPPS